MICTYCETVFIHVVDSTGNTSFYMIDHNHQAPTIPENHLRWCSGGELKYVDVPDEEPKQDK
jgi:hypothetical protein